MSDGMVTARMTQAKKDEGARVLQELGLSASQAINQFYDYLIAHKATPFDDAAPKAIHPTLAEALEYVQDIPRASRFSTMTDEEIKRERLISKGIVSSGIQAGDE